MKKAIIALMCAGTMFFAVGHPFNTNGSTVLGNKETEIIVYATAAGFVAGSDGIIGVDFARGIGGRFDIGFSNAWRASNLYQRGDEKAATQDHNFEMPSISMTFALIPEILAFGGANQGQSFGGYLGYTGSLEAGTSFSVDLGYASNGYSRTDMSPAAFGVGGGYNAMTWGLLVEHQFNEQFFAGAEIFGTAHKGGNFERNAFWQIGVGYALEPFDITLGFFGGFETNDQLGLTLGFTFLLGDND